MKQYYWAKGLEDYSSDNRKDFEKVIEFRRLNFFIGKNNTGKSKFLRALFAEQEEFSFIAENISNLKFYQELRSLITPEIYKIEEDKSTRAKISKKIDDKNLSEIFEIFSNFEKEKYIETNFFNKNKNLLDHFRSLRLNDATYAITQEDKDLIPSTLKKLFYEINKLMIRAEIKHRHKFYIPILRGMRPLTLEKNDTANPYIGRTFKDYFEKNEIEIFSFQEIMEKNFSNFINAIISGEEFYRTLQEYTHGESKEWEKIEKYQQLLSTYFFDNKTIKLIPKRNDDVIHIKISNDEQLPIYLLGDGLQQAIILTYKAFIEQDQSYAFFIEEPELHMHPGMLRQLMNFYLNETKHYYFFTTHSNHLLDMVDESDEVIIQKFTKTADGKFQINRCDKDRDLLAALGVKPSSVYLANCTIWVEGITDRLYIAKYMQQYLEELEEDDEELYIKYRRFMPNYHYAFVEYAGGNIAHWSFDEIDADQEADRGLSAKRIASDMLLIADGDNKGKADRVETLEKELKPNALHFLECKEIENTLPTNIIIATAKDKFSRMQNDTKDGFDIETLDSTTLNFYHPSNGIGRILDNNIRLAGTKTKDGKTKYCFGESSGTIKDKLGFCRLALSMMEQESWELTSSAKALCEKIFQHIERCNQQ